MSSPPRSASSSIPVRQLVLAWLCAAATIAYIHRGCLGVPARRIQEGLGLDTDQMGTILSAFFLTYALLQLPSGWIGDRWGTRRILPLYACIWSLAVGAMSLANGYAALLFCQLLCGAGQAGIFPCAVQTISVWFPRSERALPSGWMTSFMSVGAAIATSLIGYLLIDFGWREVFFGLSLLGFVWAALFFWWFRDRPEEHPAVGAEELQHIRGVGAATVEPSPTVATERPPTPWRQLARSCPLHLICLQQFFRAAGYVFFPTWFPTYLQKTRDVSEQQSGFLTSVALGGVVAGSLAGGLISDLVYQRTGSLTMSRKGLSIVGLGACAACILAAYFIAEPVAAAVIIGCGAFCAGVAGPASYALTMDLGGKHVSTIFSLMNMAGNIGAFLSPKLVAWLVRACDGDWEPVLLLFTGLYLVATVCWVFLDPAKPLLPLEREAASAPAHSGRGAG